jgi:hypothetical protein
MPVSLPGYAESLYADFGRIYTPAKLAVDPINQTFYTIDAGTTNLRQVTRDKTLSTVSTAVTDSHFFPFLDADIHFYDGSVYTSAKGGNLVRFNSRNGASTTLTTIAGFNEESGLDAFDGKLYISDGNGTANEIRQYEIATGITTTVLSNLPNVVSTIEIHPVSGHLYFAEKELTDFKLYTADLSNNTFRLIGTVNANNYANFAIDPSEQYLYFLNGVMVERMAIADGALTTFMTGLTSIEFQDLTFAPASVGLGSSLYVQSAGDLIEVTSTGNDFNYQPVLSGMAKTQVEAGTVYQFKPTASDEDQDTLTFSIVNAPSWAKFNGETGELKGTPTAEDAGVTNAIEISVSDGRLTTRLPAFNLSVNASIDSTPTPTPSPATTPTTTLIVSATPTPQPTDVTRGKMLGTAPPPINFSGGKKGIRISGDTNSSMLKGNDFIYGNKKNNSLSGMEGNDHLFGKQGNDRLLGGAGNDQMDGGKGDDLLEDSSGDDLLKGGKGRDRLFGGVGADILVGGSGADTLAGGSGADLFTLTMEGQERDRILDFDAQEDLLDLRQIFAAPQFAGVSPSDRFEQFVRVEQKGANTEVFLKMEGMGNRTSMNLLATIDNVSTFTLSASQFVVS